MTAYLHRLTGNKAAWEIPRAVETSSKLAPERIQRG